VRAIWLVYFALLWEDLAQYYTICSPSLILLG